MRYVNINNIDKVLFHETWVNSLYFQKREQKFESVGRDFKLDETVMKLPNKVTKFYTEYCIDAKDENERTVFSKQVTDEWNKEKSHQ